jgi:putative DNA primase/helicase
MSEPRPVALSVSPDNIPAALKARRHWVCWRYALPRRKWTKIPYDASGQHKASSTAPITWAPFENVFATYQKGEVDGIGYVLSEKQHLVAIDLDHCRDAETGAIADWAQIIVTALDTYTEVSPSGTGLHLFLKGTLPVRGGKRGQIEVYQSARYVTITGNHLADTPTTIKARQEALNVFYQQTFETKARRATPVPHASNGHNPLSDDDALLQKALEAKNGSKFSKLWAGDTSDYPSASEADLALCGLLSFWTKDAEQIDRLFRRSDLYRDKWDEPHGETTYGERTIHQALAHQTEHWTPPRQQHKTSEAGNQSASGSANGSGGSPQTPYSDQYNAEAFVKAHGQNVRYCEDWDRWLIYDGKRWKIDNTGEVMRLAKHTIKTMAAQLVEIQGEAEVKAFLAHIKRSLSMRSLEAMVKCARSEPGIPVTPDAFDRDPWLFNVQNGTIDLRTGELYDHRREDLLMKVSPVPYLTDATCPLWEKTIHEIYAGDEELIRFDQKVSGYTLTGDTREQIVLICHGSGANGKSTKQSIIREIMGEGEYALRTNIKAFMESTAHHQPGSVEYYIAKLHNVRFAYASEGEEGARLSESLIKDVTGGVDHITGRHPYGSPFSFRPRFKLWLATNHEPVIRGTDPAIWRRTRKIPFTVSFEGREDKELFDKLRQELPGILRWAVKGCLLWQMHGLEPPKAVKDATVAYRRAMDVVGRFIEDCCTVAPYAKVESTLLYQAYVQWCTDNGEQALSQRKLAERLRERGLRNDGQRDSITRRIMWEGIGLPIQKNDGLKPSERVERIFP